MQIERPSAPPPVSWTALIYDGFSRRSDPDYPDGTFRQRWHRTLRRRAMEPRGFAMFPAEWWHFDYQDWRLYRLGNVPFERLGR